MLLFFQKKAVRHGDYVQLEEGNTFEGRASLVPTLLWSHTSKSLFLSKTKVLGLFIVEVLLLVLAHEEVAARLS